MDARWVNSIRLHGRSHAWHLSISSSLSLSLVFFLFSIQILVENLGIILTNLFIFTWSPKLEAVSFSQDFLMDMEGEKMEERKEFSKQISNQN